MFWRQADGHEILFQGMDMLELSSLVLKIWQIFYLNLEVHYASGGTGISIHTTTTRVEDAFESRS